VGQQGFFRYVPRRVECPTCGIRVEKMPWVSGKHRLTESYAWFLAGWAKRLSWKEVAEAFRTTWDHVFCSVERAVVWGREHQNLSGVKAIGIDEIAWQRGHRYLTLVYPMTNTASDYSGWGRSIRSRHCCNSSIGLASREVRHFSLSVVTCGNPT